MGPVKTSFVTFFVPAVAMGLDAIINGRVLGNYELVGACIIMLSIIFLKDKARKKTSRPFFRINMPLLRVKQ